MKWKAHKDDWLPVFLHWAGEPCPAGEWIYRGQAARCDKIEPRGLRGPFRGMYRNALYDVDYEVAKEVFQASPVFKGEFLYPHVIDDKLGLEFANFAYSVIGGPPITHPKLSLAEVVRALAQHYDYATLFVDVSLNPIVAALFATHRPTDRGYAVDESDTGVVYRWPALRKSPSRLSIETGERASQHIQVIDISRISPHMCRPHNQHAALAAPVHDLKPMYQPFGSPVSKLVYTDMAKLPCCQTFCFPKGSGHRLCELDGVSMDALFPDAIDLGYSYINVIALLSMIAPSVRDLDDLPEELVDVLNNDNQLALAIANAILGRECLRIVQGLDIPQTLPHMTCLQARLHLTNLSHVAREAAAFVGSKDIKKELKEPLQRRQAKIQAEAERRRTVFIEALREVIGTERAAQIKPPKLKVRLRMAGRPAWLRDQLDARLQKVDSILETTEFVPVYALEHPEQFKNHQASLPSSDAYEKRVREQLAAQKRWLNCELFGVHTRAGERITKDVVES